jgi:hypothetical protein
MIAEAADETAEAAGWRVRMRVRVSVRVRVRVPG